MLTKLIGPGVATWAYIATATVVAGLFWWAVQSVYDWGWAARDRAYAQQVKDADERIAALETQLDIEAALARQEREKVRAKALAELRQACATGSQDCGLDPIVQKVTVTVPAKGGACPSVRQQCGLPKAVLDTLNRMRAP